MTSLLTHMSDLTCESRVLEAIAVGTIVEITFRGVHEWTHGSEMSSYIKQAIDDHSPVIAVVINLLGYDYEAGDDISGLFAAFIDRERHAPRPACIVATGRTYASMYAFFQQARLLEAFRLRFVSSVNNALEWLLGELRRQAP